MKTIPLRRLALLAPLLAAMIDAQAIPAIDSTSAAWREAGQARIENGWQDGHAITTIVPAVPGGAVFTFIYAANPNDGFASTAAPAAGAGCNAGETLGECRKRALTFVAAYWGSVLQSNVPITVDISMPQIAGDCSNRPWYLGRALISNVEYDFAGAPHADTVYVPALANALAGSDLSPSQSDFSASINEGADHGCESPWAGWWYGTDADVTIPFDRMSITSTMLHEFGHGLGFLSNYSGVSGGSTLGMTPNWGYYLYDVGTHKLWKDMSNAERVASATNDPNLVWTGPDASRWVAKFLSRPVDMTINTPAGSPGSALAISNAGVPLRSPLTADVVVVDDGVGSSARDGCETPFANAAALAGGIALMDGYNCSVGRKIRNAQSQGAIAVLIANTGGPDPQPMYVTGRNTRIPAYGITQALGDAIFADPTSFNVTLQPRAGTDALGAKDGCVRMHAPTPVQSGSSLEHFSGDGLPSMLMQPNSAVAMTEVGLALNLLRDSGWKIRGEDGLFVDGFDGSPCAYVQP